MRVKVWMAGSGQWGGALHEDRCVLLCTPTLLQDPSLSPNRFSLFLSLFSLKNVFSRRWHVVQLALLCAFQGDLSALVKQTHPSKPTDFTVLTTGTHRSPVLFLNLL